MAVFEPVELTNGYAFVTALTAAEYNQRIYDGWVPVGGGAVVDPPWEPFISRLGTTPGQVAVLQADGTIEFETVGGVSSAVDSVNGLTGDVVLDAAAVGAAPDAHTHLSVDITDATSAATASTVVERDVNGWSSFAGVSVNEATATLAPSSADRLTRRDYVDTGDTAAKARANHTGTQTSSTISDLTETVQDIVGAFIVAGTGVTVTYDDVANTFTINATGGGGSTDAEVVRDTIGAALVAGSGIQITVNDAGDSITIASTAVLPTRQVNSGTGLTGGGDLSANRTLAVSYGSAAGTAVQGNDARVTADQAAGTASIRTLGTSATSAAAGNHTHSGLTADQAAGTASIRTLGTSATSAAAGNHTHTAAAVGAVEAVTVNLKMRVMTQAAYDGLGSKDATTLYIIQG